MINNKKHSKLTIRRFESPRVGHLASLGQQPERGVLCAPAAVRGRPCGPSCGPSGGPWGRRGLDLVQFRRYLDESYIFCVFRESFSNSIKKHHVLFINFSIDNKFIS